MAAKKRSCLDLNIKLHEVLMSRKVMITPAPPSKHWYIQKQGWLKLSTVKFTLHCSQEGWQMVKSETRRDAKILVRKPNPRLFDKKFRESKKVQTNHGETRLRDLSKMLPRFRDPAKIFWDPRFFRYHSPPMSRPSLCPVSKSGHYMSIEIDHRKTSR